MSLPEEQIERARRKLHDEVEQTRTGTRRGRLLTTALWHVEQAQARLAEAKRLDA